MIHILAETFQKKVSGKVILDRAAVVTVGITLRNDQHSCPAIRCDLAYGTENEAGEFEPWDYNNPITTIPVFLEGPAQFAETMEVPHHSEELRCGCDLAHELLCWIENLLVAKGHFGDGAKARRTRPAALDLLKKKPAAALETK